VRAPRDGVRIRAATPEDIPAVAECDRTSTTDEEEAGFGLVAAKRVFADRARLSAAWEAPNRVGGEEVYVANLDDQLVGFVVVEDRGDELELDTIDVDRDYRRRGIGTLLVRFVEEYGRRTRKTAVTLGTSRSAEGIPWKSFRWWLALGYRETGEVTNDWTRKIGAGVREIRMRRDLR
jgi:ribosomal protein S18 acetylase RimI-like enzyme